MTKSNLLLVDAAVLPEGFQKVVQAKRLLKTGAARNLAEAARMTGISRSTFYKYKDHVFAYHELGGQMLTVHVMLQDRPGVLSMMMSILYEAGANVLTLNQNIPISGFASVSMSIQTEKLHITPEELLDRLRKLQGVQSVEQILGN